MADSYRGHPRATGLLVFVADDAPAIDSATSPAIHFPQYSKIGSCPRNQYCLMPTHVHRIAVPKTEDGLRRAIGEAHRSYTRRINFREKWRGYPQREMKAGIRVAGI